MTNTNPKRHEAGSPVGGQFAETVRPEATTTLDAPPTETHDTAVNWALSSQARLEAMHAAGVADPEGATRTASRALAKLTQAAYPDAVTITTGECDQAGCTRQHLWSAKDSAGNILSDDLSYDLEIEQPFSSQVELAIYDLEGGLESSAGGYELEHTKREGTVGTLDIAKALERETQPSQVERAESTIATYRARFDDLDLDDRTAARDMLTDLVHWADANGHDLHELLGAAQEAAAEESWLEDPDARPVPEHVSS